MQSVYEEGKEVHSHKPEYEKIAALGPMCNNNDLVLIIKGGDICNLYGLDTISAGNTIGFAMDLYDRGIITKAETGVDLSWGNADGILEMLELMGKREDFGDVLADGVKVAARKVGKNAADFAYHLQGQEVPMHDPKYFPGLAIGYHLDDTPGRHMHNNGWAVICPPQWLSGIGRENANISAYKGQG